MQLVRAYMLAFMAAASAAHAVEVVSPRFPTPDVVLAETVLNPSAAPDFAPLLQKAVDAVAERGGGTVYLTAGDYGLRTPVLVRRGVTIRGDYSAKAPAKGSVLRLFGSRGDENAEPAFRMENGSGLVGLVFFYPEQSLRDPVPYPWTVRTAPDGRAGNNQTIADCTFVNSWMGIRIGPEVNECHTFRRVRICALRTGFHIDMTTDIGRITDVVVSPKVWCSSGFPGSPALSPLRTYLQTQDTAAAVYTRSDWEYIRGLRIDGYRTGIRFTAAEVPTNAVLAGCDVSDCATALDFIQLNWVGVACYNSRFAGIRRTAVCAKDFRSTVLFNACTLTGGAVEVNAHGLLSFSHCLVSAPIDDTSGGRIARDDDGGLPPEAARVSPRPMVWPRPGTDFVLEADGFGASPRADDNTVALQRALDAEGRNPNGGTVYLRAGYYRVRGTLKVPSGVELRGSSDVPHHTQNAGTVLLTTHGAGDEKADPFLSLAPGSGLRGLGIWYPEQPLTEPTAYPWAVRALGPKCWLTDVNLGNAWLGVDFATRRSDGHRLSYVSGGFYKVGVYVGNSESTGWVEDIQFNPHYMLRRPHDLPVTLRPHAHGGEIPVYPAVRSLLRGIAFRDCADEQITGTFLYAAREGLVFSGMVKARVLIHGTDTGCRGIRLSTAEGSDVSVALAQLVPLGADEEAAIVATQSNAGSATFRATQIWPRNPVLVNRGSGRIVLDQYNSCAGGVVSPPETVHVRLGHHAR